MVEYVVMKFGLVQKCRAVGLLPVDAVPDPDAVCK